MEIKKFDIAVIGGGPGGYPAAIKAAQCGKSVALIEAKAVGGTCLNRGCIPSKALIANAEILQQIKKAEEFGIVIEKVSFDYKTMVERKNQVVESLRKSLEGLISANKITLFRGFGEFLSPREIKVKGQDNLIVNANKIIIATGSEPRNVPAFPFDYKKVHDSTSLLELTNLPSSIVIIGGGIIGCEFASLFATLGTKVTILELLSQIIPMEPSNISQVLSRAFQEKGILIETSTRVQEIDRSGNGVRVKTANGKIFEADIALVAVGRKLNTDGICLNKAGVTVLDNGMIDVNTCMETNVDGIYAVGDIASKWWLAHVATHQGIVAASNACGIRSHMDYKAIPNVIFTSPEIGTVGMSMDEAQAQGYSPKIGLFPFQALGKSQASLHTEGFAQVVQDKRTGQVLGAQVVGHEASTLIAEMALVIANELTIECVEGTIHAHPTISEAWLEAALIASGTPLHFPPSQKHLEN